MHFETLCVKYLKRQPFRTLPRLLCFAMAVIGLCILAGCNHRKLPPELKYATENVELIRKSLKMQEPVDNQRQKVEQQGGAAVGSGDASADSDEE